MPKIICHEHCPRGGRGGGGWLLAVLAVVVLALLGAAAHAVAPAAGAALRAAVEVLKIAGATVAGASILGALGWLVVTRQQGRQPAANAAARVRQHPPAAAGVAQAATAPPQLPAAARVPLAIEAPRPWARETSGLGELPEPQPIQIRRQS